MKKKAIIISLKGKTLSKKEKMLLLKERPWGVILFKRNIYSLKQHLQTIKLSAQCCLNSPYSNPKILKFSDLVGGCLPAQINIFNVY